MQKRAIGFVCSLLFGLAAVAAVPMQAQTAAADKPSVYLYVAQWDVPRAQWADMVKADDADKPVLDKLVADGTITSYGTDMDDYHTGPLGVIYEYFTVPDAASLDKANKAIEAAFEGNPAISGAYRAMFETDGHRDYLTRLRYMVSK